MKKSPFHYFLLLVIFFSCSKDDSEKTFKSNFSSSIKRTWVGPEYWTNPLQDWQISDGELVCLVSNKNRNIHLLTRELDTIDGNFNMQVGLTLYNTEGTDDNKNWIGFEIGSKGNYNDYRDDAVFGKGLSAGITTNGNLFIGNLPESNKQNEKVQMILKKGAKLNVALKYIDNKYDMTISLFEKDKLISTYTLNKVPSKKLIGQLVLKSNYNFKKKSLNLLKKSVLFKDWTISGSKIKSNIDHAFGPILFSQYTLSRGTLKLTAQMAPVILNEEKVLLQVKENNTWKSIQEQEIDIDARTATFELHNWDAKEDISYRLAYKIDRGKKAKEEFYWEGTFRKDPIDKEEIVIAGFTGNSDLGFPNSDIFKQVEYHNPDVMFFSGDQIYESIGGYGTQRFPLEKANLDYLRKWYIYGWTYRDLMKDRPTVSITDDHDMYQGNIWGEGGKNSPTKNFRGSKGQDAGGYMMLARWVKMVERTQTSHLPNPFDPTPVAQGIGTYYTDMVYGGISFAILEDRKFKSAPAVHLPKARINNGWIQNKKFDVLTEADIDGVKLLGDRQMKFLNVWSTDWSYNAKMKMLLSQTIFTNVATLPQEATSGAIIPKLRVMNKGDYPPNDFPVSDFDSNAWPQTARDNAVKTIRKGFAFHLAGDQHLGSTIQYGVEEWNDSGYAFCVPSISNYWPRRWYPFLEGKNRDPKKPRYTGEFKDGFGNKMTVHAVSNPTFTGKKPSKLYDRATGYGIVRLNKRNRKIIIECWARLANPAKGDADQYEGWPIVINQEDNYGRKAVGYLPEINISGKSNAVIEIINEKTSEIVYSLRLNKSKYTPKVFDENVSYTVKVGEPDTNIWKAKRGVVIGDEIISFKF